MKLYISHIAPFSKLQGLELLSNERQLRVASYSNHADKVRCLVAGLMLKRLLGAASNDIITNEFGKPYIPSSKMHFNISHSGDYVVLSVDEHEVGVDIERNTACRERISKRICTPNEIEYLLTSQEADALCRIWTAKESVVKAEGIGLAHSFSHFSVLPLANGVHTIKNTDWYLAWYSLPEYTMCSCSHSMPPSKLIELSESDLLKQ